ncbi:MAG: ATP-dependent DNA helicase RecG [Elusimicrobia bacterium]|nr:ATP-dependent DNA helicase RecG [Elusimicrobiota bacterium]
MLSPSRISVQYLKGVGPARSRLFHNLGVSTVEDLLFLFPRRYEDRRKMTPVGELIPGEWHCFSGQVTGKGARRTFWNKKHVLEVTITDGKARIICVWFNQPYLEKCFHEGQEVVFYGRIEVFKDRLQCISPEYEVLSEEVDLLSTGRIVPVYPLTKGMTQRYLRRVISGAVENYAAGVLDVLPEDVREAQKLWGLSQSLQAIHFPGDDAARLEAERRVSFDEFFLFQISVILRRLHIRKRPGVAHQLSGEDLRGMIARLPFPLTRAQDKAVRDVLSDMRGPEPMLRLLQGDVGSGKTVVAFLGCLAAVRSGHQAAVMAPTEILAEQHYRTFQEYFGIKARGKNQEARNGEMGALDGMPSSPVSRLSSDPPPLRTALLNSSLKKKDREAALKAVSAGEVDIIFGTHALIEEAVAFKDLSFVVIDEQHKFGVKQRALLTSKGQSPDVLVMTATPIPRTLCLTLYGDLDVSLLDEKPAGRGEIKTYLFSEEQASGAYGKVAEWVKKGTQAYIVYPVIEGSEKQDLKAASVMYDELRKTVFKGLSVGLVHGRMDRGEARGTMAAFQRHEIDVLFTTTVLEVGIDVPNANVMLIEHAERFGLSQLHQLRGRIGRSEKSAVCILLGDPVTEEGRERLEAIVSAKDGFKIAEADLKIRGPGQYFGRTQHGLNELRVANPLTQMEVLEAARKEASALVKRDPLLSGHAPVREAILRRYPEYLERVFAG